MVEQGGNVRQALVDIARQATSLLQRYEQNVNGHGNTIENQLINPLENPAQRTAGTSALAGFDKTLTLGQLTPY